MPVAPGWYRAIRVCPNGRTELQCIRCNAFFWLTARELTTWRSCPACLGWWRLPSKDPDA